MTNFNFNKIRKNKVPYIIAEIGVNHECSIRQRLILSAKKGGTSSQISNLQSRKNCKKFKGLLGSKKRKDKKSI